MVVKDYYVYIMVSKSGVLYIGVTNNLERRVYEHKNNLISDFSAKYKTHKLVYFESSSSIIDTIFREKQLKGWRRSKKEDLINKINSDWEDISRSFDKLRMTE